MNGSSGKLAKMDGAGGDILEQGSGFGGGGGAVGGVILDFKQLFLRLHAMRQTFQEQGEEDSFAILFEEN